MVTVATLVSEGCDCQKQSLRLDLRMSDADEVAENA